MQNPRNASITKISFALHVSIVIYLFILYQLSSGEGWTRDWRIQPDELLMVQILTAMSVLTALLAVLWPKFFMKSDTPDQTRPLILDFRNVDPKIQTVTILRMALAEAAGIYGLVAAFLNRSLLLGVPYLVGALIVQFVVGAVFGRLWSGHRGVAE